MLHLFSQYAKILAGSKVRLCCIVKTVEWFLASASIVVIGAEHLLVLMVYGFIQRNMGIVYSLLFLNFE